jgi:hypothetical protein
MRRLSLLLVMFSLPSPAAIVTAQEKAGATTFTVGEGKIELTAPAGWTKKQPQNRIIEAEFATPAAAGDEAPGRLTAMGAGGSIDDNVNRWAAQFAGDNGAAATPKRDKLTVSGSEIHIVDLSGTYKDTPGGPFAGGKTVMRDNYRMLGAIIQTKEAGNYFLKLYGPKATIDAAEKDFQTMVKNLKIK